MNYKLSIILMSAIAGSSSSCITKSTKDENSTTKRPNILFIMSDDHAYQAISAYNHAIGKLAPTPNIDRIAA